LVSNLWKNEITQNAREGGSGEEKPNETRTQQKLGS
jgi:hypothetical protein